MRVFSMWRSREGDEARDSPIFEQNFLFFVFFFSFFFFQSPKGSHTCSIVCWFYFTSWRFVFIVRGESWVQFGEGHIQNQITRAVGTHAKINELGTTGSRHDLHRNSLTLPA